MKKVFFMLLLFVGIALFSCQEDLPIEPQNQQGLSNENDLTGIGLRAADILETHWGYDSERYIASREKHVFNSSSIGAVKPGTEYIVDYIEVTKKMPVPAGYTAVVEETPNAGYLLTDKSNRGISGKVIGNQLVMNTHVYAVRTDLAGVPVNVYMPKIHTNSNDLQQLPWNVRKFEKQKLIAHRGFHRNSGKGENTVGAFIKAQEKGVYGSEIDVWVTADGYPVVYHDDKFYNKTIVETKYSVLKDLEGDTKLPKLEEFLDQVKISNSNTRLVLDIKPRPDYSHNVDDMVNTDIIMNLIQSKKISFSSIDYLSFSQAICEKIVQRAGSTASVYLLIDETHNHNPRYNISSLKNKGIYGVSFGYQYLCWSGNGNIYGNLNTDKISEAKRTGMKVNVWTVNQTNIMGKLLNAGVDYISTDFLDEL